MNLKHFQLLVDADREADRQAHLLRIWEATYASSFALNGKAGESARAADMAVAGLDKEDS